MPADMAGRPRGSDTKRRGQSYTADVKGCATRARSNHASNFNQLEVAWRFKTDNLGTRPEFKLEGTPLMVKGVIYATGGTRRSVVALDGKTGELMWVHAEKEGMRAVHAPRQLSGRGLSYWTDGKGDDRVIYVTPGFRLVSLNAKTGVPISGFGTNGIVDMKVGAVIGKGTQIDLETGEIGLHSTPTIAKDYIIVGSSFREGLTVKHHNNTKGFVRAYDVKSGKLAWQFNTIPRPGEFGNDTWKRSRGRSTGTRVWTQITVDEELGIVYAPVEDPTSDLYGGHRPGNTCSATACVALDLKTGQRKWHFQVVHHPIWDFDLAAAPLIADIVVAGKPIKAVALASKQGFLYVFDRVTGQPVWPIEERPVPQTDVPGEKTSPTQPFPTKPPAYSRNGVVETILIDFTPELKAAGIGRLKPSARPVFTPPVSARLKGRLHDDIGNAQRRRNRPGSAYDPSSNSQHVATHASRVGSSSSGGSRRSNT